MPPLNGFAGEARIWRPPRGFPVQARRLFAYWSPKRLLCQITNWVDLCEDALLPFFQVPISPLLREHKLNDLITVSAHWRLTFEGLVNSKNTCTFVTSAKALPMGVSHFCKNFPDLFWLLVSWEAKNSSFGINQASKIVKKTFFSWRKLAKISFLNF